MNTHRLNDMLLAAAGATLVTLATGFGAWAGPIGPGFDLFHTPPGGGLLPLGDVVPGAPDLPLMSRPIGPGNTDTIVERLSGLPDGGTGVIEAEIVALSLQSINPVQLGPSSFFDVFVTLDVTQPSVGQINVTSHGTGGGTFDSFFDVFTEITFTDTSNPSQRMVFHRQDRITSQGSDWSHTPSPGYPEDAAHPSGGFYPGPINHTGPHPHTDPATPEPGSLLLLVVGGIGTILLLRRRHGSTH